MAAIPEGFKLAVLSPEGTIVETFDLAGLDVDKPLGAAHAADLMADVALAAENHR